MLNHLQDYMNYLKETLGLKELKSEELNASLSESVTSEYHWVFVIENYSQYTTSEKELLTKMVKALNLELKHCMFADQIDQNQEWPLNKIYYFLDSPKLNQAFLNNQTYSPRTLIKEPQLKKAAWESMKKFFAI